MIAEKNPFAIKVASATTFVQFISDKKDFFSNVSLNIHNLNHFFNDHVSVGITNQIDNWDVDISEPKKVIIVCFDKE